MALVTVDGGNGYWTPHPGDDALGMVIHELIPLCQERGLGTHAIGMMGISMGGFGALMIAENYPHLVKAVAAISPAIWTTYAQAHYVNPGAYANAAAFRRYDAVTHTASLRGRPVRVASGQSDPFHPYVVALADALPRGAIVTFPPGAHTSTFFRSQEGPSMAFLSEHL